MSEKEEKTLKVVLVAKHVVFDANDGTHFDYWQKFVRVGKYDIPIKIDKKEYMARAFLNEKMGI